MVILHKIMIPTDAQSTFEYCSDFGQMFCGKEIHTAFKTFI